MRLSPWEERADYFASLFRCLYAHLLTSGRLISFVLHVLIIIINTFMVFKVKIRVSYA